MRPVGPFEKHDTQRFFGLMHLGPRNEPLAVKALVDLLVQCHEDGLFVRDPSPAVLRFDSPGQARIGGTDLERRSYAGVPHLALGQLWSLMHGMSPRRKIQAAEGYCRRRGLAVDFESALRQHMGSEIERCFHENRDFKIVQAGGLIWHVRRELMKESHRVVLHDPDAFLNPGSKLIKDSRGTSVAATPGATVLKRFNLKKYRNLVKHRFAASRARRAFQRAYHLEMLGLRTPRAIAFANRVVFGCVYRSYLLLEYVPAVTDLAQAIRGWTERGLDLPKRRALAEAGRLIGLLHDAGFANRDLKATNILVTEDGEVWLIDLDGLSHTRRVRVDVRVKNLRRIVRDLPLYGDVTAREAMIFLRAYTRSLRRGRAADLFRSLAQAPWA